MVEHPETEIITKSIEVVGKEVYNDLGHPVAEPTGKLAGLVPRAIKAAFLPLEKWILKQEYNLKETEKILEEKLKDVPPENIESPEPYVAVPAIQNISYCMDNDALRELYAKLLAKSMVNDQKNKVHPSYVDIIKQLSPDEAKLLNYLAKHYYSIPIPTISLRRENTKHDGIDLYQNFSILGELAGCDNMYNTQFMFDNLCRLRILEPNPKYTSLTNEKLYDPLKEHPFIVELKRKIQSQITDEYNVIEFEEGYMKLTEFGKQFCQICVLE